MNKFLTFALAAGVGSLAFAAPPLTYGSTGNMAWATVPVCAEVFSPVCITLDPVPMCFGKLIATSDKKMEVTLFPLGGEIGQGCVPILGNMTATPRVKGTKAKWLPLYFAYIPAGFNKGCYLDRVTHSGPPTFFMGKDSFDFKLGGTLHMPKGTLGEVHGTIHVMCAYI
jgi:hypothetical protein